MLTLDLEDTASLDNKHCQVVLEMPEKYESSCKKLTNQDAQLLEGAKDSILISRGKEEPTGPGRPAPEDGAADRMPGLEGPSPASASKADLALDLDDIDLADDITIENEMQKPPPKSILQEDAGPANEEPARRIAE